MAWLALVLLGLGPQEVPPPGSGLDQARALRAERRDLIAAEGQKLEALADRLSGEGQAAAADRIRKRVTPTDPPDGPLRFVPLPEVAEKPAPDELGPDAARPIFSATTRSLFELAQRAAAPGVERFGIAAECLRDVLARDPGHPEARRLLGFVPHGEGGWATPQAAQNLGSGMVLHPVFGWVPGDWTEHLDAGELPAPRADANAPVRWLPAEEADALRRDFNQRPWKISTEHFDIATNVPLAEAIVFGRRLEALHDVFETVLADLLDPAASPLARRFREPVRQAQPESSRHVVWYLASRDEYVALARNRFGRDESLSLGFYLDPRESRRFRQPPRSYFYRDPDQSLTALATLFHEASHQVLFETAGPTQFDRNVGQYWVWEGLGTYFETFTPLEDGSYELGGRVGPRVAKARTDIVEENRLVPLSEFTAMGEARFKDETLVYSYYAEAMAWTLFLMHHDHARHRDAFLEYVRDAYRGRFRPSVAGRKLIDRLGVDGPSLDGQLRTYLGEAPKGPAS